MLIHKICEEEVIKAIWNLEVDKAPGLDGFSIHFFWEHLEMIKKDLIKMLNWTRRKGKVVVKPTHPFFP